MRRNLLVTAMVVAGVVGLPACGPSGAPSQGGDANSSGTTPGDSGKAGGGEHHEVSPEETAYRDRAGELRAHIQRADSLAELEDVRRGIDELAELAPTLAADLRTRFDQRHADLLDEARTAADELEAETRARLADAPGEDDLAAAESTLIELARNPAADPATVGDLHATLEARWRALAAPGLRPAGPPLANGDDAGDVAISPDGRFALTASDHRTATLWRLQGVTDGGPARFTAATTLEEHARDVEHVAFGPRGRYAVTASRQGPARLYALDGTGGATEVARLSGPGDAVGGVAFDPAGRFVVVAGSSHSVTVWRLAGAGADPGATRPGTIEAEAGVGDERDTIRGVAIGPGGGLMATAGGADMVGMPYSRSVSRLWRLEVSADGVDATRIAKMVGISTTCVAISPRGERVLIGSITGACDVWQIGDDGATRVGQLKREHPGEGWITDVAVHPDGEFVLVAEAVKPEGHYQVDAGALSLWRLPDGGEATRVATRRVAGGLVGSVAFGPNGRYALAGINGVGARLWRVYLPDDAAAAGDGERPDGER